MHQITKKEKYVRYFIQSMTGSKVFAAESVIYFIFITLFYFLDKLTSNIDFYLVFVIAAILCGFFFVHDQRKSIRGNEIRVFYRYIRTPENLSQNPKKKHMSRVRKISGLVLFLFVLFIVIPVSTLDKEMQFCKYCDQFNIDYIFQYYEKFIVISSTSFISFSFIYCVIA